MDKTNGYLRAFSELNSIDQGIYDFVACELERCESLEASVNNHLNRFGIGDWNPVFEGINWQKTLKELADKWFFSEGFHERNVKRVTSIVRLVQEDLLKNQLTTNAWKLDVIVPNNTFYECVWDDLILETNLGLYLIHFGVSD